MPRGPVSIVGIRRRVERQEREDYIYDSVETATADRRDLLILFDTEQTMHAAWRKRAEAAEAQLQALQHERNTLGLALNRMSVAVTLCVNELQREHPELAERLDDERGKALGLLTNQEFRDRC